MTVTCERYPTSPMPRSFLLGPRAHVLLARSFTGACYVPPEPLRHPAAVAFAAFGPVECPIPDAAADRIFLRRVGGGYVFGLRASAG